MRINCSCGNSTRFLIPLWVRVTFRFEEDGTIAILHLKQLESLEEKLTEQGKNRFDLACRECGSPVTVKFNEFEAIRREADERKTLEDL